MRDCIHAHCWLCLHPTLHCCCCRQYDEYIASVDVRTEYVDDKSNHQRVIYKFR
jgi:hypothetical protein